MFSLIETSDPLIKKVFVVFIFKIFLLSKAVEKIVNRSTDPLQKFLKGTYAHYRLFTGVLLFTDVWT